ncbi:MAG: 30S ribosomal protein S2 [Candidatus Marinimicrobia bacterium]|nr:30S ribosomal protein S2 [Candidatus Neomarinimicrobiota bacterium]
MEKITVETLLATGAHFGHLTSKWNPAMKDYIFGKKNGIHIIDLEQTLSSIEKAGAFLHDTVRNGGEVLFVGTKKQAKSIIEDEATKGNIFYITERWLGGTLTNFVTIKRSIRRMDQLQKESEIEGAWKNLTKKEILGIMREKAKLELLHRGIKNMKRLPDAVFVVDSTFETTAINEARRLDIPVIAITDTNANPKDVDFAIPANDDSYRTIQLITKYLVDTVVAARNFNRKGNEEKPVEKVEVKAKVVAQ